MQDRGVSEAGASPSNPSPGAHSVERLEPTTLRLTARHLHFSGLLSIAIYCLVSVTCKSSSSQANCGDYPQLPTILKESPHKIPHSELRTDFRLRSSRLDAISNTDRLRLMRSYSTASALPRVCSGSLSSGLFLPITAFCLSREVPGCVGKACCNPAHHWVQGPVVVTELEFCKLGHPLTGDNVVTENRNGRLFKRCRTCLRENGRAGRSNTFPQPKVGRRNQADFTFAISVLLSAS